MTAFTLKYKPKTADTPLVALASVFESDEAKWREAGTPAFNELQLDVRRRTQSLGASLGKADALAAEMSSA